MRDIITIINDEDIFNAVFEIETDEDAAWYDLDGEEVYSGDEMLRINADGDVTATYFDAEGNEFSGTIGDEENDSISDSSAVEAGATYYFREGTF